MLPYYSCSVPYFHNFLKHFCQKMLLSVFSRNRFSFQELEISSLLTEWHILFIYISCFVKVRLHENSIISDIVQFSLLSWPFALIFQKKFSLSSGSLSGKNWAHPGVSILTSRGSVLPHPGVSILTCGGKYFHIRGQNFHITKHWCESNDPGWENTNPWM